MKPIQQPLSCPAKSAFSKPVVSMVLHFMLIAVAHAQGKGVEVRSPDGRNQIAVQADDGQVTCSVRRDGRELIKYSQMGLKLANEQSLGKQASVVGVRRGEIDERFQLRWNKTSQVTNRCSFAIVELHSPTNLLWEIELRAYDDGVAFRYRIPQQPGIADVKVVNEMTAFDVAGEPHALASSLDGFRTSHESLYQNEPLADLPTQRLLEMPLLLTWSDGPAAAITEARVREYAGGYLERSTAESTLLQFRHAPLPSRDGISVVGETPFLSPWRVFLLDDVAGKLLESNLLLCLNDPLQGDFDWLHAGKTTWHWWSGEFEDDYKLPRASTVSLDRHRRCIDFCKRNDIAYHAVSGDGFAWYQQSRTGYGKPALNADVRVPRPEIRLREIIDYANKQGVGIRLWVHWKPLSKHLEESLALYRSWGVKGLMVDFLNRDDQEMVGFTEKLLESAARHKLHVQLHGSSKYTGEQRTFPHLFNREGVLNLEFLKWSADCTPDHNVNVAYTRGLTGPVDYHLGGFQSASRDKFQPRNRAPMVLGTRCHHMALYVVYENPMPMVCDTPESYEGQTGFDFIVDVPTTWDETRFVMGEPGEFIVLARRKADAWYLGGVTNWSKRRIVVPLDFLGKRTGRAKLYVDGSMDESRPNDIRLEQVSVDAGTKLDVSMAPGGGFATVIQLRNPAAE